MKIESLRLFRFRNYEEVNIQPADRLNVFIGENAQGKTNILEAIFYLTQGVSFRSLEDQMSVINKSHKISFVEAKVHKANKQFEVKIHFQHKKNIHLNQKTISSHKLAIQFPALVFSPESLSAIKEGAELRRVLLDEAMTLIFPTSYDVRNDYKKAQRTRNRVLKDYQEKKQDRATTEALLESIFPQFLDLAVELTWKRLEALAQLEKDLNNAIQYILDDKNVDISIGYFISKRNIRDCTKHQVLAIFQQRGQELLSAELSTGTSLIGPHRHDIKFYFAGKDSRFYCSQGQQRAIIVAFKVAQIMVHKKIHHTYPFLLLDDVLSELDQSKQKALMTFLREIKTQVFLTTTDFDLIRIFSPNSMAVFQIREGQVF